MKVQTAVVIQSTPEALWPLLTRSTMNVPGCFCLGLPKPIACELPTAKGELGAERRCLSDRGTIIQRITRWEPPHHLEFEMVSTDHCWASQVETIRERFHLAPHPKGVQAVRTTALVATTPFRHIKEIGFYLGLKRVHLYVFKNWRIQLTAIPQDGGNVAE